MENKQAFQNRNRAYKRESIKKTTEFVPVRNHKCETKVIIFCKDNHFNNLARQLKLQNYEEIKHINEGNFTISIIKVESIKQESGYEGYALKIKRESSKTDSLVKCRQLYENCRVIHYPSANKEILTIKPKNKIKIVEIIV